MGDRIAAEYRAAIATCDGILEGHRKGCHDCQAAKVARELKRMCVKGWRLHNAKIRAEVWYSAYKAEQADLAAAQPTLF